MRAGVVLARRWGCLKRSKVSVCRSWSRTMLSFALRTVRGQGHGGRPQPSKCGRGRVRPLVCSVEQLERRELLTSGTDYVLTGFTWNNPAHITYSFAPDGVFWDHGVNNIHAALDAKLGAGVWETQIERALATWESVANVDFTLVPDSAHDQNALGLSRGDPRFGDIRFGGYGFANNTTTLAETYSPPPNGSTAAGDVEINTNMNFGVGQNYDLYSVMLHEIGHSLGLDHVTSTSEVMHPNYQGVRQGLGPGDVAGVQAIYGARTPDPFQSAGRGLGFATAVDLSGSLGSVGAVTLTGVSLFTPGDTEFFTMVAPGGATGSLQVIAAGYGFSLLSPKVSLYDANGTLMSSSANSAAWNTDATINASGITPGQRYFVAITGATLDAFSIGSYGFRAVFSTSVGSSFSPGGGNTSPASNDSFATATPLGTISSASSPNMTLANGSESDYYVFRNARAGVFIVSASGTHVRVVDAYGNVVATGLSQVAIRIFRTHATLYVEVSSASGDAVSNYGLTIGIVPPSPSTGTRRQVRREHAIAREITSPTAPSKTRSWAHAWSAGRGRHDARSIGPNVF